MEELRVVKAMPFSLVRLKKEMKPRGASSDHLLGEESQVDVRVWSERIVCLS
jgi:hypothetical protein